ncbi:MAG TPA: MFS transporter [Candidatus Saccharimonadales bacterium]|nr:MFS transporter [Candidatus Saccharimonadales bacterium]
MFSKFFRDRKRQTIALIAVVIGSAVAILDGSIVNLALPKIESEWHSGYSSLQWISDAYLLSLSSLILLGGSLGDIFGRKKVYLIGVAGFGISSLLCALSPNVEVLIAMRVLQGVFGALLVPGALSIINTTFSSASDRAHAIGKWTAWSSIAVVASPFLGGWILAVTSWRWIFFINIPLVIACYVLAHLAVDESKDKRPRRVDLVGAGLGALSLASITYGLIEGPAKHWTALEIGALVAGVLLFLLFLYCEYRRRDPMVKLSLFRSKNFSGANLMTFLMYGALGGFTFAFVIYLQAVLHYSAFMAGLTLLPISIFLMLFSGRVSKLSTIYGPRLFMTAGPIIAGLGMALLFFLKPGDSYWLGILPGVLLFSFGLTLLVSPLTTTVMAAVEKDDSGIASGINNAIARSAGLIVVAALGLLGAAHAYTFALGLCAVMACLGGVVSFVLIEKPYKPSDAAKQPGIAK